MIMSPDQPPLVVPEMTQDLHYSGALAIGVEDAPKIQEAFLKALERTRQVVSGSREEDIFGLNIDFYRL